MAACCVCGLPSSMRTVSASTGVPGSTTTRSTVPSVSAVIQRISSGTSTPVPRTLRNMVPRFTGSIHKPPASTVGAAGLSRARATVVIRINSAAATPAMMRLRFLRWATSGGRATSIWSVLSSRILPAWRLQTKGFWAPELRIPSADGIPVPPSDGAPCFARSTRQPRSISP